jgi:hypothetical protein
MATAIIDIAAEFTGKKAFKQAETATDKLTKNVKRFAGAAGIAFGTSAILAYSKASVKAFAQDEAAALRLNRAVENLGIGFANPQINEYIANLERSAAVADDILRPAFQNLLTTTGSLTQSQKLLNDALTISRASGVSLATVSEDLGKGYIGITRGLAKYNSGLTRAELNTMSFSEILGVILNKSAGAAEDYLTTTAYKMDVLAIATGNASEIIGKGFVDALARAGGGTEATDAAIFLENMATLFNKITLAAGTSVGGITNVLRTLKNLPKNIFMGFAGAQAGVNLSTPTNTAPKLTLSEKKQQEALAKLEANAVKRNKELLALKKKQVSTQKQMTADKLKQEALDKAALALAEGQKLFDEEGIQLAAAAQGKLTDEERTRLALKTDIYNLEAAINEGNLTAAAKLANSMVLNAQKLATLRTDMIGLNDIQNPFDAWLLTIQKLAYELSTLAMVKPITNASIFFTPEQQATANLLSDAKAKIERKIQGQNMDKLAELQAMKDKIERKIGVDSIGTNVNPASFGMSASSSSGTSVVVNVAGSVSTERDLVAAITQGLYSQQASGTPVNYSTVY